MLGQRVINNMLGNKPKADRKSKNNTGWSKVTDTSNYTVWSLPQKPMHNPHSVVVKTEEGEWVTFVDMGRDGGTNLLNRGGSKEENIRIAKNYMNE